MAEVPAAIRAALDDTGPRAILGTLVPGKALTLILGQLGARGRR